MGEHPSRLEMPAIASLMLIILPVLPSISSLSIGVSCHQLVAQPQHVQRSAACVIAVRTVAQTVAFYADALCRLWALRGWIS